MADSIALLLFLVCLFATLASSELLVRGLTVLGMKLTMTEGSLGLLAALGADAPEITTAIVSLVVGAADIGQGVVLGSNLFNLAMLLGLSALLAGRVIIRRQGLVLDGVVGILVLVIITALLLNILSPLLTMVTLVVLLVPYIFLVGLHPRHIDHLRLPDGFAHLLAKAASQIHEDTTEPYKVIVSWIPVVFVPGALVVMVVACFGLVETALTLTQSWHVPRALVGVGILAALTSLPNAYASARLAMRGRGAAVVSATVNSNTINLVFGLAVPALVLGVHGVSHDTFVEVIWLFGMTVMGFLLLLPEKGMTRLGGIVMMLLYAGFVLIHLLWSIV
jgi:cation:H+ antiporter